MRVFNLISANLDIVNYKAKVIPIKPQQEKRIMTAANAYIQANEIDLEVRFDVIAVSDKKNELLLTHIKNAFSPTLD